jgi:exopolysaccharide biosynthesis polyprenyl glycosylphosphotransferase
MLRGTDPMDSFIVSNEDSRAIGDGPMAAADFASRQKAEAADTDLASSASFARLVSTVEIGCVAAGILTLLLRLEGLGALSTANYVFGILTFCGFAVLSNMWVGRSEVGGAKGTILEISLRVSHVFALVFAMSILTMKLCGVSWSYLHAEPTLVLIVMTLASAVVIQSVHKRLLDADAERSIVIIGNGASAMDLAQDIKARKPQAAVSIFPTSQLIWKRSLGEAGRTRSSGRMDPKLAQVAPDVAIICAHACDPRTIEEIARHLAPLPVDVLVHRSRSDAWGLGQIVDFAGITLVRLFPRPLRRHQKLSKRAFDMAASATLLTALLPVLAVVALLVKFDSRGPVLFRQPRVGLGGRLFTVFKFRTMRADSADLLAAKATIAGDPRVTRVGNILRKTSVDELPQLLNVLLGSMSLVGPRPHAMNGNEFGALVNNYHARHRVKPGITGLAQVKGWRGLVNSRTRIEHRVANDLTYISEWSLLADVGILWRTIFAVAGKNAF